MEILIVFLLLAGICLQIIFLSRRPKIDLSGVERAHERTENTVRNEFSINRNELTRAILNLMESNHARLNEVRQTVGDQLAALQKDNAEQLEKMRITVDEKLRGTLEKRLGESFKMVNDHLLAVQKGLGEMQKLAGDVGNLQRVLTNVKDRGTWGEFQLENILSMLLTPDQYAPNVRTKPGREVVEFAVRMPGKGNNQEPVWLPIDAKFPKEDYERLQQFAESGDAEGSLRAERALLSGIEKMARDIRDKYINPPQTTDFAILFLPTEGLYAEVLRKPGFHDKLQREYHVLPAGPTTLSAIINSLRVGFQTLAIEQRSHEVWAVLGAVKGEFSKFGDIIEKVKKQLGAAANTLDETHVRTRAIERKLRDVEHLPENEQPLISPPEEE